MPRNKHGGVQAADARPVHKPVPLVEVRGENAKVYLEDTRLMVVVRYHPNDRQAPKEARAALLHHLEQHVAAGRTDTIALVDELQDVPPHMRKEHSVARAIIIHLTVEQARLFMEQVDAEGCLQLGAPFHGKVGVELQSVHKQTSVKLLDVPDAWTTRPELAVPVLQQLFPLGPVQVQAVLASNLQPGPVLQVWSDLGQGLLWAKHGEDGTR